MPPLTTIRLSRADLARAALEALRQQAEDPNAPNMQREFLVSTSLVVRGSTAAPTTAPLDDATADEMIDFVSWRTTMQKSRLATT